MLACFYEDQDITNWWMGEKYDGVRSFWNSNTSNLYSREGKTLRLPEVIYNHFPPFFVEGELWVGRDNFSSLVKLVSHSSERKSKISPAFLRFVAFDSPSSSLLLETPFERRYFELLQHITSSHPFMLVSLRILCSSKKHMTQYCNNVIGGKGKGKGEGVILRKPMSPYEKGKSNNLLKVKATIDAEALVVDIKNSLYICKLPDGSVLTATRMYKMAIQIGDVVTFAIMPNRKDFRGGDILPKICRVRNDLLWLDVVKNHFS